MKVILCLLHKSFTAIQKEDFAFALWYFKPKVIIIDLFYIFIIKTKKGIFLLKVKACSLLFTLKWFCNRLFPGGIYNDTCCLSPELRHLHLLSCQTLHSKNIKIFF